MLIEALSLYAYTCLSASDFISLAALIEGFGRGMVLTSLMVLLSEMTPSSLRGSAIGIYRTFMNIGGFIGPIFFMLIYEEFGPASSFLSAITVILVTSAIILVAKAPKEN
jgi:MFS family permease